MVQKLNNYKIKTIIMSGSAKPFVFKQFEVMQDKCAMKVGTDAVLLGAWADTNNANNILDIGTGTGILALMLAQQNTTAHITAIDVDAEAVLQAQQNFSNSVFSNTLTAQHIALQEYSKLATTKFDVIISNPPFFENSSRAKDVARNLARHNDSLTLTQLMLGVQELLCEQGIFYIVLPATQQIELTNQCNKTNMHLHKIMYVHTKENKTPKRILVAIGRQLKKIEKTHLVIELDNRHDYSPDYKALTQPYYVRF